MSGRRIIYIVLLYMYKSGHQCSPKRPIVVFVGVGRIAYLFIVIIVFLEGCCGGRPTERCTHVRTVRGSRARQADHTMTSRARFYVLLRTLDFVLRMDFFFRYFPRADAPYERPRSYGETTRKRITIVFFFVLLDLHNTPQTHRTVRHLCIYVCIRVYRRSNLRIWINYRLRNNNRTSFARMIDRPIVVAPAALSPADGR